MISDSANLVLFVVRSAMRLSQEARAAYVDATRRRELTLPLPNFFSGTDSQDAVEFFESADRGKGYADESEEIRGLLARFDSGMSPDEDFTLRTLHIEYANLRRAERGEAVWEKGVAVDPLQLNALLSIRQWRRGADPNPSALKRMAGTLIEIGIDYAQSSPGLFDETSSRGRALKSFLSGLDDIDFVNIDVSEFPARLFISAIEVTEEIPELVSGDPKLQDLVQAVTADLGDRIGARIAEIDDSDLDALEKRAAFRNVEDWGQLVFKTTLSSGAELALSNPQRYFGVQGAGEEALVSDVGGAFFDLLLDEEGGFDAVFSRDGLEAVLDTALLVVGEHPEILIDTDNQGLTALISQLALDLEELELQDGGLLPDLAQMVLLRSGQNLELLWPDLASRPQKNLLLVAAKRTLLVLARPAEGDETWSPDFGKRELTEVTGAVLDELVANPGWLLTAAGNVSGALSQALAAAFDALRRNGDGRLSPAVGAEIVRAAVRAAGLRKEFLSKLPSGAERAGELILGATIDTLLETVFDGDLNVKAQWQLARAEVLATLVSEVLGALARHRIDSGALALLETKLAEEIDRLARGGGFDLDAFVKSFEAELVG